MATKSKYRKKSVWHSLGGEYPLAHNELVVLAHSGGFSLVRYDKEEDCWIDEQGNRRSGGMAMLPLPTPEEAREEAMRLIKDEPWAKLL